jgi:hypothetical protein
MLLIQRSDAVANLANFLLLPEYAFRFCTDLEGPADRI